MRLAREIGVIIGQKIPEFEKLRARKYWDYGVLAGVDSEESLQ